MPLYLRQTQSELTGEHTCVMVRGLNTSTDDELQWLGEFAKGKSPDSPRVFAPSFSLSRPLVLWRADFRRRFLSLLSFKFREFGSVTALSVLEATNAGVKALDADPARGTVPSSF